MPKADCKPSWNTAEVCISPGRLPARRDAEDVLVFPFELPACSVHRLALDLPPGVTPQVEFGVLTSTGQAGEKLPPLGIRVGRPSTLPASPRAGGRPRRPHRLALVRQSTVYDLSLRGVEVSAQLKIEAYDRPLQQVTLALDPQMQLVAALCGDLAASWSVVSPPGAPMTRVVVTLPAPIRDGVGLLRLRALSPLVMGQAWRLPRIGPEIAAEVGNKAIFWQGGDATLLVPAPLVAERLQPISLSPIGRRSASGARSGESTQWEYFSPDATVEVRWPTRRDGGSCATATELGVQKVTSHVAADFHTTENAVFTLEAQVGQWWTIDSVESVAGRCLGRLEPVQRAIGGPTGQGPFAEPSRCGVLVRAHIAIIRTSCPAVGWEWRAWCRCAFWAWPTEKGLVSVDAGRAYQLRLVQARTNSPA